MRDKHILVWGLFLSSCSSSLESFTDPPFSQHGWCQDVISSRNDGGNSVLYLYQLSKLLMLNFGFDAFPWNWRHSGQYFATFCAWTLVRISFLNPTFDIRWALVIRVFFLLWPFAALFFIYSSSEEWGILGVFRVGAAVVSKRLF